MKESYVEGVAIHNGRELCVGVREDVGEASAAVRAGWVIEPRNRVVRGADAVMAGGRPHRSRRYCASRGRTPRGRRSWARAEPL
jgi:hypothetical protein